MSYPQVGSTHCSCTTKCYNIYMNPSPKVYQPPVKTFIVTKEVRAVTLQDALRKESGDTVLAIQEVLG